MTPNDPLDLLPLREPTFFILLSLAHRPRHGYAIIKDVEALSGGKLRLSTSTLYEALARLLDQALVERATERPADDAHPPDPKHPGKPRKEYRLTRAGRRVLEAETARMQALLSAAQTRLGRETTG